MVRAEPAAAARDQRRTGAGDGRRHAPGRCAVAAPGRGRAVAGGAGRVPGRPGHSPVVDGRHAGPGGVPERRADRPARRARLRRPPGLAAVRLDRAERRPVHLSPVRRGGLRGRVGAVLDGDALGHDPGQPGRPRAVAVAGVRRARLRGPAPGAAGRHARGVRAGPAHRAGAADAGPRPGQPAAHAARRRRSADGLGAERSDPLVARDRDRAGGRGEADPADLHPVPAADPQVPAGRRGRRGVRGHGGARLRGAAQGLRHLLGARAVPEGQPDRVPRHPGQPVAARRG